MSVLKNRSYLLNIFIIVLLIITFPVVSVKADTKANIKYITTRADLAKALSDKTDIIYVGDMECDENDLAITINKSVTLIGKPEGSLFKSVRFNIEGPEVESELIKVSFKNITFDGCYKAPSHDPGTAASFDEYHGDRTGKGCFTIKGFAEFELDSCTIKNYCSKYGAAMYLHYTDGNVDIGTRAGLTLKGCRFMDNTCEKGVLWCNGKNTRTNISDCTFTDNNAYTGIIVLGGIKGTVENVTVKDNNRIIFKEKNTFPHGGGGISLAKSEVLIKNCVIDGNSAPYGGGLCTSGTKLKMDSCKIINNRADTFGGGLVVMSGEDAPVFITNCLISGNSAEEEGAIWVYPADQIGIGLPTGIVEFSFCTIENNNSQDKEHLIFHPVMLENADSIVGRDGKIDFVACRINDDKVLSIKDGDDYNIINSERKGDKVPAAVLKTVADGYYAEQEESFYAGVNDKESKDSPPVNILLLCLGGIAVLSVVALTIRFIRLKNAEKKNNNILETEEKGRTPDLSATSPAENKETDICSENENGTTDNKTVTEKEINIAETEAKEQVEKDKIEIFIHKLKKEGALTGRELDVLGEYLKGKSRIEISEALYISESTVKNHISSIFAKTGVKNKKELLKLIELE